MSLKAGRVGVAKDQVDEFGRITGGDVPENVYTKSQCDDKFELKSHIGGLKFRDNDGTAQYQLPNGEWTNFSSGDGSIGFTIPEDKLKTDFTVNSEFTKVSGGYYDDLENGVCYVDITLIKNSPSGSDPSDIQIPVHFDNSAGAVPLFTNCNLRADGYATIWVMSYSGDKTCLYSNNGYSISGQFRFYGQFPIVVV